MVNRAHRVLLSAVIVPAVFLSGCGPDESPRARLDGDVPVVAICESVRATEVEFRVGRGHTNPYRGDVLWRLTGAHRFEVGDTITLGVLPSDMTAEADPGVFDPAEDDLVVTLTPAAADEDTQASWWGAGSLSSATWSNGDKTNPCG